MSFVEFSDHAIAEQEREERKSKAAQANKSADSLSSPSDVSIEMADLGPKDLGDGKQANDAAPPANGDEAKIALLQRYVREDHIIPHHRIENAGIGSRRKRGSRSSRRSIAQTKARLNLGGTLRPLDGAKQPTGAPVVVEDDHVIEGAVK